MVFTFYFQYFMVKCLKEYKQKRNMKTRYEGWKFNSGNYLFTTDTK